ncbi:MAG: NADH-quinone oxidoreductase subunit M [Candidatus Marsarchaeota archaeon]|jgi:NADH-quinone oxidoreductase subunit M|nr:NADH-quinone oxidoreductase subunit M [Candidatus Marsarchaeota archaeon]
MALSLLPLLIILPFISILPMLALGKEGVRRVQKITAAAVLLLSVLLILFQGTETFAGVSISYISFLGVNFGFQSSSISAILVLMSSIVFFAASLVFQNFIKDNERIYGILFALVQGSSIALFLSSNLLVLYLFWEVAEFAMFFIILMYGSTNRRYAAIKFIIYSIVSSMLLFLGFIVIYLGVTPHTFNISAIINSSATMPLPMQLYALVLLFFAFAIKTPIFPLHNWLPDAHTEAPATGSMVLAGVLLKFGGYGFILMLLMIPLALKYSVLLAALFALSSIYSALVALRQSNIKRAIAYTSITEMGIVAFGIISGSAQGLNGALYAMLAHGIAVSLLFLIAGTVAETYGTLDMKLLRGIIRGFKPLAWLFIFGTFAAIGIPLTSGFIGDLLIFIGSYSVFGVAGLVPLAGILIIGGMLFWITENVFLSGKESVPVQAVPHEVYYAGIFLAASTVLLGLLPFLIL